MIEIKIPEDAEVIKATINWLKNQISNSGPVLPQENTSTGPAPEVVSSAPEVVSSAPEVVSSAPEVVSSAPEVAPAVDVHNRPWDERIDSKPAKFIQDGSWKPKRRPKNMIDSEWAAYRQDILRQYSSAPVTETPADTQAIDPLQTSPASDAAPVTETPAGTQAIDPLQTSPTKIYTTFEELNSAVVSKLAHKTLTNDQVLAACRIVGIENYLLLATRPELIPAMALNLGL